MRRPLILILIVLTLSSTASATNYFVDTTGNDTNNGLTISTPWKTITKLNSSMASLLPGDTIFFRRGQRFYGTLTVTKSGSVANPIIFDAYGTGKAPEISGFYPLTAWTAVAGYSNVWQSTLPVSRTSVNMVTRNKIIQPLGRWPNSNIINGGYRTIASCTSNTSLTDASNFPANFVGGEAAVRTERWTLDRSVITAQSGKSLTLSTTGGTYPFIAGFGFFVQNHINCLDQPGEWAFDNATNKLYLYCATNPNSDIIEVSMLDETVRSIDNVTWTTCNNYKIRNLSFTGSNTTAVNIWLGSNVAFENDSIYNHGFNGMNFYKCNNYRIRNCFFNHIDNSAIRMEDSHTDSIENNTIRNIATVPGKGGNGSVSYFGIRYSNTLGPSNSDISYNSVDSVGECGIYFGNTNISVSYNTVSNVSMVLDDIGAIYAVGAGNGSNCRVFNNISSNNIGCIFGSNATQIQSKSAGIYLDEGSAGVSVFDNICYNNSWGMILNNSNTHSISNNTFCNNRLGVFFSSYASPFVTANNFKNNIVFTKDSTQLLVNINTPSLSGTNGLGVLDSNYYGRPLKRTGIIKIAETSPAYAALLDLPVFSSRNGFDAHTYLHPTQYSNLLIDTMMYFYVNTTLAPATISLPYGTFKDARGVDVYGSFILQPFTSRIVLRISNFVIPVSLLSFQGKALGCNAQVSWQTAGEISSTRFELGQSTDGINFSTIAEVDAGTVNNDHAHTILAPQSAAKNYYRLKIIDKDGAYSFSPIEEVKVNCYAGGNELIALPNPVNAGQINLTFKSTRSGIAVVLMNNSSGQLVTRKLIAVNQGINNLSFPLAVFSKGMYMIQVLSNDGKPIADTKKIIIE